MNMRFDVAFVTAVGAMWFIGLAAIEWFLWTRYE